MALWFARAEILARAARGQTARAACVAAVTVAVPSCPPERTLHLADRLRRRHRPRPTITWLPSIARRRSRLTTPMDDELTGIRSRRKRIVPAASGDRFEH